MSKTKQIIHTTFWFNNIWQGTLVLTVLFANLNYYNYAIFAALISFLFIFLELLTLKRKYNVKFGNNMYQSKNILYFISDERDKEIAYKVHTKLIITYQFIIAIAIIFSTYFLRENHLLFIVWVALALYVPNIQYYVLWNHYDKD
ncbi:hypothetical protein SAMN05216341_11240 [Leuconostocaceae bacterium R-53105]|uniref:Uncharacterized protein n=1 Tax=Convivina intestini TaxID=1505726 RepID=A0A2U1D4G9_9LACO|nr:hypothetical protein C7384_1115 [Convivina intestini]CAH1857294.1 hypothetical protein R077811_01467 [Convivina intestini]SDC10221.1 hypothetical protein SAMN05216341_11240 [Leuconostocaceae bacterium R-53105]